MSVACCSTEDEDFEGGVLSSWFFRGLFGWHFDRVGMISVDLGDIEERVKRWRGVWSSDDENLMPVFNPMLS